VLIAVDTNVLLDQAVADEDVLDALAVIRDRLPNGTFCVLPTVLEELGHQLVGGDSAEQQAAETALSCLREWGYQPINVVAVGKGITEQIAFKLRSRGVLPDEEINDGFIIAEAAIIGCDLLLSSDGHLLAAQENPLLLETLRDSHVDGDRLVIGSPRTIVRRFFRRH